MNEEKEYTMEELLQASVVTPDMMLREKRCIVKKNTISRNWLKQEEINKRIENSKSEVIREHE